MNKLHMQSTPVRNEYASDNSPEKPGSQADLIPSISKRSPRYMLIICLGFAFLYGELMLFASLYYNAGQELGPRLALTGGAFLLFFLAMLASFTLPHRIFLPRYNRYSPIIFLMMEWVASVIILVVASLIFLTVSIFVVKGDLGAIGEMIRSLTLYTLAVCVITQGSAIFVRYVQYLYEREMHQSYKIVTIAGITGVALIAITLYLLPFDLNQIGLNTPNNGLLSLHLSIRDVWLLSCALVSFFWHISVIADH